MCIFCSLIMFNVSNCEMPELIVIIIYYDKKRSVSHKFSLTVFFTFIVSFHLKSPTWQVLGFIELWTLLVLLWGFLYEHG